MTPPTDPDRSIGSLNGDAKAWDALGQDGVLLPYQRRWIADRSRVKVVEKTRRCGLSWAEAADATLEAAKKNGMDTWYIGYTKDMAEEFIRDCANWAKYYALAAEDIAETEEVWQEGEERKSVFIFQIRFASGFRVTAMSAKPKNFRGKKGRAVIDEAAFHDNLAEVIKAALAFLIWGGRVHFISTHDGVNNPFNELIQDVRAGKAPYSVHRIPFRDAVDEGLYRRICLRTGETWSPEGQRKWVDEMYAQYRENAAEELDCVPKDSGGTWLSRALIEKRMSKHTKVVRWACPPGFELMPDDHRTAVCAQFLDANVADTLAGLPYLRSFYGMDFGRSGDLSVIWIIQLDESLTRRVRLIIELRNCPFRQQEQVVFFVGDKSPRFTGAKHDARGNGQALAEYAQQRWGADRVEAVMLSEGWYRDNTPRFKEALEDGDLDDIPRDEQTLSDLRAFEINERGVARIPDRSTQTGAKGQRHGDSGIAGVLGYAATCIDYVDIEFDAVGDERDTNSLDDFMGGSAAQRF